MNEQSQITLPDYLLTVMRCDLAAPLVVNGGSYAGCQRNKNHEGAHEYTLRWS